MKIKYTRGDHEIRPEWSALYIILVGGKVLRFAVCGLRFAVASCGCGCNLRLWSQIAVVVATCNSGRRLLSKNKRKGAKSGCALLFRVVYCSERTIDTRENNRIRQSPRFVTWLLASERSSFVKTEFDACALDCGSPHFGTSNALCQLLTKSKASMLDCASWRV